MNATLNSLGEHIRTPDASTGIGRLRARVAPVGRFLLHVLEMSVLMVLGMAGFGMLADQLRDFPALRAAFRSSSDLYILGDALFMSLPMVVWMLVRGHDRRHSLEMGASMLVPGLAIVVLGWLGADRSAPWLRDGACGFMCLGMLAYMVLRYNHFSAKAGHAAHATHVGR
jgi:hypothetical protein